MIWHIFKKDLRLLWPVVLGVALANLLYRLALSNAAPLGLPSLRMRASGFFDFSLLATAILVVLVAQQEAIPGVKQDWLVRPIKRLDLLLSKLLFVVLLIQAPILVIEIALTVASGFPPGEALLAPLSHSLWMLLALELPVLAFASLTRNLAETVGAAFAVVLALKLFPQSVQRSGWAGLGNLEWVSGLLLFACLLLAAVVLLGVQYYRRNTRFARWIGAGTLAVCLLTFHLPWQTAFAVQSALSPRTQTANSIQVNFDNGRQPLRLLPGLAEHLRDGRGEVILSIPLLVTGIPSGGMLVAERLTGHLKALDGTVVPFAAYQTPLGERGTQNIPLHENIYKRLMNQTVSLDVDFTLALLRADSTQSMPALNGDQFLKGVGVCHTRTNVGGGWIEVRCVTAGQPPCTSYILENPLTGENDGWPNGCEPTSYSPWPERIDKASMAELDRDLHFQQPDEPARFPIDESQLRDSRVSVRTWKPEAFIARRVTVPEIRLSDWRTQ